MTTNAFCDMSIEENKAEVMREHDGIEYYFNGKEYYYCCLLPRSEFDKEHSGA